MSWNYRVVKRIDADGDAEYGIHECHYEPTGWTQEPVAAIAESVDGLRDELHRMLKALDEPVIEDEA